MNIQPKIKWMLWCAALFSIQLLILRMSLTGRYTFIFLAWNLFLAWIPLYISNKVITNKTISTNKYFVSLGFLSWLLFFPNAPYLITDLFHLEKRPYIPLWFDLTLLISFAWCALMFAFISLSQMYTHFQNHFSKKLSLPFVLFCLLLSGYGIYLGRYGRYNSWDVITNPLELIETIIYTIIHPIRNWKVYGMTLAMSSVLIMIFGSLTLLIQNNKTIENEK